MRFEELKKQLEAERQSAMIRLKQIDRSIEQAEDQRNLVIAEIHRLEGESRMLEKVESIESPAEGEAESA